MPSDVAGSQEVRDQFRRHEAQQQMQRQSKSPTIIAAHLLF
jgi:hypothetical protein